MYDVGSEDRVVALADVPQSNVGAPMPALAAAEHHLELGYLTQGDDSGVEKIALRFQHPYVHHFGPPNDEAFDGHPLAARRLEPYGAFRIEGSSWIRSLSA